MRKGTILGFVLLFIFSLTYLAVVGVRRTRVEQLKDTINRNVKTGASAGDIRHFLEAQALDPSPLQREPEVNYAGHKYNNLPIIIVLKRDTGRTLFVREDTYMIFVFSEENKLLRFDVFPVFTGL